MSRRVIIAIICCSCIAMATVVSAASFTLTTKKLGAASVATPIMFPDQIVIANKGGGHLGKVENGDIITFVWSRQVDEPTLCSGWSNTSSTQNLALQWSVNNGVAPAHDTLTVTGSSATCSGGLRVGSVDLGAAGYNTGTSPVDYKTTSNALSVGATTTTLTVTLNGQSKGASLGTVSGGGVATWTPDSTVADRAGNSCGNNLAVTSSTTQF
jgi:hypothetical protein